MKYLVPLFIGTLVGVVGGALPGITITMTVIVVLPFTFGLEPLQGLAAMIGVYVGGETGGLITSLPARHPRQALGRRHHFDGFPMAQKGEPGRALWLGIWASIFGGLLGAVFLVAATGPLAADRARVRAVGVLLAVRARAVDGRGAGRSLARQGPAVGRDRPARHGARQRPGDGPAAPHPRHPEFSRAASRSCRC